MPCPSRPGEHLRDLRAAGPESGEPDLEGPVEETGCVGVIPLGLTRATKNQEAGGQARVARRQDRLLDRHRSSRQLLRLVGWMVAVELPCEREQVQGFGRLQ